MEIGQLGLRRCVVTKPEGEAMEAEQPSTVATKLASAHMARWYLAGTGLIALVFLWVLLDPDLLEYFTTPRASVQIDEQGYEPTASQWHKALDEALNVHVESTEVATARLEGKLASQVSELFELPRANVEKAADWYYSMEGRLYRMTAMLGADVVAKLSEKLFPEDVWSKRKTALIAGATNDAIHQGVSVSEQVRSTFHDELAPAQSNRPPESETTPITLDFQNSSFIELLINDPVMGQHAIALASGSVAAVAARRAGQIAVRRTVATATGGKLATSCVAAGPMSWLCAAGVFSVVLVSSEVAAMVVDETMNRGDFEQTLHAEIDRLEESFSKAMQNTIVGGLRTQLDAQKRLIEAQVRPIEFVLRSKS